MGMVKKRAFGADIDPKVKKKLYARQQTGNPFEKIDPNSPISDVIYDDAFNKGMTYKDALHNQFDGVADLSSRKPFARLWTAVDIKSIIEGDVNGTTYPKPVNKEKRAEIDAAIEEMQRPENKGKMYYDSVKSHINYLVSEIDRPQIYSIGNHTANVLQHQDPLASQQTEDGTKILGESIMRDDLLPPMMKDGESDYSKQLHSHSPPAGITGISAETQGAFGLTIKTTVNFIVYSQRDFENIFSRYFLKPGAQVFLDYGWSNIGELYDPMDTFTKFDYGKVEEAIYGIDGIVESKNGDLMVSVGNVANYDAKYTENGIECMIEFISKNAVLMESTITKGTRNKLELGLDIEVLRWVASFFGGEEKTGDEYTREAHIGGRSVAYNAGKWSTSAQSQEEVQEIMMQFATDNLGGRGPQGLDAWSPNPIAKRYGIFTAGESDSQKLYVSLGWLEDNMLNGIFGEGKINDGNKQFQAHFNSSNSFATFSKWLLMAQPYRKTEADFLYPANWDANTYSEVLGRCPDDRLDESGNFIAPDNSDINLYGEVLDGSKAHSWTKADVAQNRVPLRECFISTDIIKSAAKDSPDAKSLIKGILSSIKNNTEGIVDLVIKSTDDTNSKFEILDRNQSLSAEMDNQSDWFQNLFVFNPGSPNAVSQAELSFTMPQGNLSNQIAIQAMSGKGALMPISAEVDDMLAIEQVHRKAFKNLVMEYVPNMGDGQYTKLINAQLADEASSNQGETPPMFADNSLKDKLAKSTSTKPSINRTANHQTYATQFSAVGDDSAGLEASRKGIGSEVVNFYFGSDAEAKGHSDVDATERDAEAEAKLKALHGIKSVSSLKSYFMTLARNDAFKNRKNLLPIECTLKIYGMSSLQPGSLFRVNELPMMYFNHCYFQLMNVSHEVTNDNWVTTLVGQMRLHDAVKKNYVVPLVMGGDPSNIGLSHDEWMEKQQDESGQQWDGISEDTKPESDSAPPTAAYDTAVEVDPSIFTSGEHKSVNFNSKTVGNMTAIRPVTTKFANIDAVFVFKADKSDVEMGQYNYWFTPGSKVTYEGESEHDQLVKTIETGRDNAKSLFHPESEFENNEYEWGDNAYEYEINPMGEDYCYAGKEYIIIVKGSRAIISRNENAVRKVRAWGRIGVDQNQFLSMEEALKKGVKFDNLNDNKNYDSKGGFFYGTYTDTDTHEG